MSRREVYNVLLTEKFDSDESIEDTLRRADRYAGCGEAFRRLSGSKCKKVVEEGPNIPQYCGLRDCGVCGPTFRMRLVNRYLRRIRRSGKRAWFVTLSFAHELRDWLDNGFGWLFKKVGSWLNLRSRIGGVLYRMFHGAVFCGQTVSKVGDVEYLHLHGIVLSDDLDYSKAGGRWFKLTGSSNVDFQPIRSMKGVLFYMAKYLMSHVSGGERSAESVVDSMKVLSGVRMFRGFGLLYGREEREVRRGDNQVGGVSASDTPVSPRSMCVEGSWSLPSSLGSLSKSDVLRAGMDCPCGRKGCVLQWTVVRTDHAG